MEVFLVAKKSTDLTSAGVPWSEVPEFARPCVAWMDNRSGPADESLPPVDQVSIPPVFDSLPRPHPDRPRGTKPMIDANASRARLANCPPGSWLISPYTGWKWAKWPDGEVSWVPSHICLPELLCVDAA
jgi:hypothetical protein